MDLRKIVNYFDIAEIRAFDEAPKAVRDWRQKSLIPIPHQCAIRPLRIRQQADLPEDGLHQGNRGRQQIERHVNTIQ